MRITIIFDKNKCNNMSNQRIFQSHTFSGTPESCVICEQNIESGELFIEIEEQLQDGENIAFRAGKYHSKCIPNPKYFIAFLDILGFKKFAENSTLKQMLKVIENLFSAARASTVRGQIRIDKSINNFLLSELNYVCISDSIIIYEKVPMSEPRFELVWKDQSFRNLITGLEAIYQEAFKRKIFLRGGISYGECIIKLDPDNKEHIILGKPYIQSYELEEKQSWMGIAFHQSMGDYLNQTTFNHLLTEYSIPLKTEFQSDGIPNKTIKWVNMNLSKYTIIFDQWITPTERTSLIKSNTLEYFNSLLDEAPPINGLGLDFHVK